MSTLVNQIHTLAHQYVRSGSKENRRLQVGRMIKFVEFIEQSEQLHNLHEVGKRHVIQFWKAHRDMAQKTANAYWLAICVIWQWSNKPGTPPKPNLFVQLTQDKTAETVQEHKTEISQVITYLNNTSVLPSLEEISIYLEQQRHNQKLTLEAVNKVTGISIKTIADIESGKAQVHYVDLACLSQFYANRQNKFPANLTEKDSSYE
ncbi:helix-turn-helix transcriptional regulator [Methylomonas paludis]|uniref:Helix-turn-helix transcriptional regulator n=1 Tax=Methylomonas paludis TaxID=1173101 RepID=A0A975MMJ9_9GAMM|nr:helix-turn-helix transcriptional regulator [Methylomonas paludis]QWF70567.1 helix-turn-helix transcriptional regulator [Methylomonas paludis]